VAIKIGMGWEGAMSAGFDKQVRVSDAERDAAAAELREHYAAGRLTTDELDERISQVFAAKTRGDVTDIMHDLPSLRPGMAPLAGPGQPSSGAGWAGHDQGRGYGWGSGGSSGPHRPGHPIGPGHRIGTAISAIVALCLLAGFGVIAATGTGIGGGRPFAIIVLLAAFAFLRRLLFRRGRRVRKVQRVRTRRGPYRRRF
jgi:hypothetical protein